MFHQLEQSVLGMTGASDDHVTSPVNLNRFEPHSTRQTAANSLNQAIPGTHFKTVCHLLKVRNSRTRNDGFLMQPIDSFNIIFEADQLRLKDLRFDSLKQRDRPDQN